MSSGSQKASMWCLAVRHRSMAKLAQAGCPTYSRMSTRSWLVGVDAHRSTTGSPHRIVAAQSFRPSYSRQSAFTPRLHIASVLMSSSTSWRLGTPPRFSHRLSSRRYQPVQSQYRLVQLEAS
mmetsp:Transcript_11235/g.30251  ORF Transcript_11235/g.30251 Transcript_11235/m.30251 type:complete len:122 (+) Transcript_11235:307-672(+)